MDLKSGHDHDLDGRWIDDGLIWLFSSVLLACLLYQRYFSGKFPESFRKFPEIFRKFSRILFFRKSYNPICQLRLHKVSKQVKQRKNSHPCINPSSIHHPSRLCPDFRSIDYNDFSVTVLSCTLILCSLLWTFLAMFHDIFISQIFGKFL